ncbi:Ferrochelatase, mitochondrial [Strongyloides ratti]|uniref:Ferrochelatase n=1 Tax=Strongyloides ratti TaxID=34506 RepID=A0A090MXY9_STRRB|nr:Ferrochelatase, mitochondrial [Strongyloides ratti]CEF66264.1 Ferrochelatase, mitochondrial [Strongyloides ratti]
MSPINNFDDKTYLKYLKSLVSNHIKFPINSTHRKSKTGILIINTGTPKSYGYWDLRSYLKEFLSDQRVIEVNKFIWYPILYLFILTIRPFKKKKCYKSIWNMEKNESPLLTMSKSQRDKIFKKLSNDVTISFTIDWAFRYGPHNIEERINTLVNEGCDKLIILPLFPQYSQATVGGACDEVYRTMLKLRYQPPLRIIPPYYETQKYIEAIGDSILHKLTKNNIPLEVLLFSYHGIPLKYSQKGDPYGLHCHKTTEFVLEYINNIVEKEPSKYNHIPYTMTTYSSRFGPMEWLKPYTDDTVKNLGEKGCKSLGIISPSFHTDCLETWEELRDDLGQLFIDLSNGGNFVFIDSLNDTENSIDLMCQLINDNIF